MFLGLTFLIRLYTATFSSLILDISSSAEAQSASFCFSIRVRLKIASFHLYLTPSQRVSFREKAEPSQAVKATIYFLALPVKQVNMAVSQ
jgi:hypothetical protein